MSVCAVFGELRHGNSSNWTPVARSMRLRSTRPVGSMTHSLPTRSMLASSPCCATNRQSAAMRRASCRSDARWPLGRRHQTPGALPHSGHRTAKAVAVQHTQETRRMALRSWTGRASIMRRAKIVTRMGGDTRLRSAGRLELIAAGDAPAQNIGDEIGNLNHGRKVALNKNGSGMISRERV